MNAGRLVGQITVDDIVHIIQEEAGEDVLLLSGAGDGDINEPIHLTIRTRLIWLVVNLGTAMIAASVVGLFQGAIAKFALLAVLMPIVSGMGGNAGTQTLAVVVRALATNQLTDTNTWRMIVPRTAHRQRQWAGAGRADRHRASALFFGNPLLGGGDCLGDADQQSGRRIGRHSGAGDARPAARSIRRYPRRYS